MLQEQPTKKKIPPVRSVIGTAVVRKDSFTGKKYWVTWGDDGHDEETFSGGQPLVFPPDQLQVGTRIHFLPPEEE